jgi:hypothetical protein
MIRKELKVTGKKICSRLFSAAFYFELTMATF